MFLIEALDANPPMNESKSSWLEIFLSPFLEYCGINLKLSFNPKPRKRSDIFSQNSTPTEFALNSKTFWRLIINYIFEQNRKIISSLAEIAIKKYKF